MILLPNIFPISFTSTYLNVILSLPCRQLAQPAWNLCHLRAHRETQSIVTDYPKSGLDWKLKAFFLPKIYLQPPPLPHPPPAYLNISGFIEYLVENNIFRESQKNPKEFLQKPQNVEFIITKKVSTVHGWQNFNPGLGFRISWKLSFYDLHGRRHCARVTVLWKPSSLERAHTLYVSGSIEYSYTQPTAIRDYYKYSFYPRTITQWNKLPRDIAFKFTGCFWKCNFKHLVTLFSTFRS